MPLGKFGNMYPLYMNSTPCEGFNNLKKDTYTPPSKNIIERKRNKVSAALNHIDQT